MKWSGELFSVASDNKNYKKQSFALEHDQYAVLLRRRFTQITKKNSLNARQRIQHACKIPQKNLRKLRDKLCFQAFFAFAYPNHEFETKQAYKKTWDRSLSSKIKGHEVKSTNFFYFGSIMLKDKWWARVSYGFC